MEENKKPISKARKEKIGRYFFFVTLGVEIILLTFLFYTYFQKNIDIYNRLSISLVILWVGILVAYYSWAIYFYNINYGLTYKDWEKIEEKKDAGNAVDEPDENPNSEQTFGLPPGTVRGTIAITLLIGALAMIIVAFGRGNVIKENEVFVDTFDFFKTAFLMMIAFYFGQKSLEYLLPKNQAPDKKPAPPDSGKPVDTPITTVTQTSVSTTNFLKNDAKS